MLGIFGSLTGTQKKLALVFGSLFMFVVLGAGYLLFPTATNQGFYPEQPIPFSHKKHAGQYKIDCQYCHTTADKGQRAGIPPVATCMNCHSVVKTDSPHIQKIHQHYKEGKPIEWIRIHQLPEFVRFKHQPHIRKGVACQKCHGPIEEMDRVYQYGELTMGWCMDCHRGKTTPKKVLMSAYPGEKHPEGPVASVNCRTCHY